MDAADLLRGPRGRRLCYEFAQSSADPAGSSTRGGVDVDCQSAVEAVAEACNWAMYWQPPHRLDVDLQSAEWLTRLEDIAEAFAASPATNWWSSKVELHDQHLVQFVDENSPADEPQPTLTGLRAAVDGLSLEHSRELRDDDKAGRRVDWKMISGAWWSAPITHPGVHTARSIGQPPLPVGLVFVEDSFGWTAATSWQVSRTREVRILQLDTPEDWVDVVRRYPLEVTATPKRGDWWRTTDRDGRWAMPDWPAVAEDWDAVHLSVAGYLTTAGRALAVDRNTATVLAGWPPDATFWLADVLRVAGGPRRWHRDRNSNAWTQA
ncbi:MAG: hypothetical protein QOE23_3393 [Pseudonocardiales bacterium]|nr:hypothetical protein [Pseudonocardiales bacterium]